MRAANLLLAGFIALGFPRGPAAAEQPRWMVLADCAAAYRANAQISDPGRPASMTTMVSEVADDYAKAAALAYRKRTKAPAAREGDVVQARIGQRTSEFRRQPRTDVEHFIDACPQVDG
ncbi:MAG TPA: hypothetical protein VGH86_14815 [Phenylobacterium sp.]|jgi:hypothetical protein